MARRQAGRVKRVLVPAPAQGHFQGYVEGMQNDGTLRGWVYDRTTKKGRVAVGLYTGDTLIVPGYADIPRGDVRDANGCDRECGFSFTITDKMFRAITKAGGHASVRTMGTVEQTLGQVEIVVDISDPEPDQNNLTACAHVLSNELAELASLLDDLPQDLREGRAPLPDIVQPPFSKHDAMFSTEQVIPEVSFSGHPGYLDYIRYRSRLDDSFPVAPGMEAADRFLYWYLVFYRSGQNLRVPMSATLLDYLNAPLVMGGQQHALSRAIWWCMAGRPDLMSKTNLNDRDSYLDILFWWANQQSTHMYYEDCLVPDRYADFLRGVHPTRRLDAFPLSYFTERFFNETSRLHFLRPATAEGRKTLALSMMVIAAQRPDLLRYIPRSIVNRLLAPGEDGGPSDFEGFVNDLRALLPLPEDDDGDKDDDGEKRVAKPDLPAPRKGDEDDALAETQGPVSITRDAYTAALRTKGFDLVSYGFMTRDRDGNRFEAAALPPVDPDVPEVDVQLIGPLAKASGLGQATRQTADILRATGLGMRGVDFDLDNPAPEGFSTDTEIGEYGPAKVNIIHLNAESIPLAFAYQPDVFSGAYNIGYFFWELDRPAYCHYLGLEMLDEVWVSTEYGVEIYGKETGGKPVINVGMCYEDTPDITREEAAPSSSGASGSTGAISCASSPSTASPSSSARTPSACSGRSRRRSRACRRRGWCSRPRTATASSTPCRSISGTRSTRSSPRTRASW